LWNLCALCVYRSQAGQSLKNQYVVISGFEVDMFSTAPWLSRFRGENTKRTKVSQRTQRPTKRNPLHKKPFYMLEKYLLPHYPSIGKDV
jgi:hypothetical protein